MRPIFDLRFIVGSPDKFRLEERIFNTFCSVAVVVLFLEVFFNYFIGLVEVAAICLVGSIFSAFLYYLARFKRNTKLAIRCMGLSANFTFFLNYFFNSGISGPNLLLFSILLLITIVIVPKRELWIWISLNFITVFGLLIYEYFYPQHIPYVYTNGFSKVLDFLITYVVVGWLICFTISFMRNNYDKEREIVSLKNKEIETQANQILQQNIALERLNSEKAKLFSIVAHDIRSPLSSILGYLAVLKDAEVSSDENERITKQLYSVTKGASEMLSNVLAWSKTQMQGARVEISSINLAAEVNKGLNLEKASAIKKNIKLDFSRLEDVAIAADLNMFLIVMRNLVNNAIKFTPEGGSVIVSSSCDDKRCLIAIEDDGLGICADQRAKLFQLKAMSTFGTNNEKGVGLGLLLCKEFAALQGGEICYQPNDVKGSTFSVSFNLYKGSSIQIV